MDSFLIPKGYLWNENIKEYDSKGDPLESAKTIFKEMTTLYI